MQTRKPHRQMRKNTTSILHDDQEHLLFDMDLEPMDQDASIGELATLQARIAAQIEDLWQLNGYEEQLLRAVQMLHKHYSNRHATGGVAAMAAQLADNYGYRTRVRYGKGTADVVSSLQMLRHSFIVCSNLQGAEVIVDVKFKDAFEIAHRTPRYSRILAAVPEVFVGPKSVLSALVRLLADELSRAYADQAFTVPPWRSYKALMSRWAPARFEDAIFSDDSSASDSSADSNVLPSAWSPAEGQSLPAPADAARLPPVQAVYGFDVKRASGVAAGATAEGGGGGGASGQVVKDGRIAVSARPAQLRAGILAAVGKLGPPMPSMLDQLLGPIYKVRMEGQAAAVAVW